MILSLDDIHNALDPDLYLGDILAKFENLYPKGWIIVAYNKTIDKMKGMEDPNTCNLARYTYEVEQLFNNEEFLDYLKEIDNIDKVVEYNQQYNDDLYDLLTEEIGHYQTNHREILKGLNEKEILDAIINHLKSKGFNNINNPNY